LITVTGSEVKGAHDAAMVIVAGKAYVVAEVNDVKAGEGAGWPEIYCALSVINIQTMQVEKITSFAKSKEAFANETLPHGACFVPRIIRKDAQTLRCYFACQDPEVRQSQMWYRDFDIATQTFQSTIHRVKLKTEDGVFDMQPVYFYADAAKHGFRGKIPTFGMYLFDSFKPIDGKIYIAINNFANKQNALAIVHDDLETVEMVGHYNEPQDNNLSESAVNRLPDGSWLAICRQDGGTNNYMFTTSNNGINWTKAEYRDFVPNGGNSKPTFDKFNGVYYLGWQESTQINGVFRSVFNIDISTDGKQWKRKYRFETEKSFQYPFFYEYEGHIWLVVTQGDTDGSRKERIMFGKLE
jgi:hypothetical protein